MDSTYRMSQQRGQGLVESLITMVIIFGTIVALMSFQSTLAYNDSLTAETADATLLAVNQLEVLRDYQVLNVQNPYTAFVSMTSGTANSTGLDTTYKITWTITNFTLPTYNNAAVTVTWKDRRNISQTITLVTRIAGIDPTNSSTIM